jgi:lantibiotic leader peptide-processing serine protease
MPKTAMRSSIGGNLFLSIVVLAATVMMPQLRAAAPTAVAIDICTDLFETVFGVASTEPLAVCQWNMALIGATSEGAYERSTGKGVMVGVIDSGIDTDHPDIVSNLDLARSCSFITTGTPTAAPQEIGNGDCSNKTAVEDLAGHGTHVASIVAAPINGIGIAGVAPDATIIALKVCTEAGFCFADAVAAALRYAGDQRLDIVNLSLFADPYLFYCGSDAAQRAILRDLQSAARYAQQRGVLVVAAAGNEQSDLQHPGVDAISPDWPPDSAEVRDVRNNCRVAPVELPGVLSVSAVGPIGIPGYDQWLASYSSVGMSVVDVAAPGGDYFAATETVQDAIIGAIPKGSDIWDGFEPLESVFPGLTVDDGGGGTYVFLNGTSMSSPHAAGVAALIKELHPNLGPAALKAAVQQATQTLACPPNWQPLGPDDQRERCYGRAARTSFFGHGLLNASAIR